MDRETKDAIKTVIAYLDVMMETTPSRRVSDTHNHLEELLEENE